MGFARKTWKNTGKSYNRPTIALQESKFISLERGFSMQRSTRKMLALTAALVTSLNAHAVNITVGGCNGGDSGLTTCETGATVVNFNSGAMPTNFSNVGGSGGQVVSGSAAGLYAAPVNDSTAFLSLPSSTSSGMVEAALGSSQNYFGIYWGSIDAFNTLTFLDRGVQIGSFTGDAVIADVQLEGNQAAVGSNEYVNFYFGSQVYDTVLLSSTNYAFESDNFAYGTKVSAPASAALLGLGLLIVVGGSRRRKVRANQALKA
jgi:hypothetical protein